MRAPSSILSHTLRRFTLARCAAARAKIIVGLHRIAALRAETAVPFTPRAVARWHGLHCGEAGLYASIIPFPNEIEDDTQHAEQDAENDHLIQVNGVVVRRARICRRILLS